MVTAVMLVSDAARFRAATVAVRCLERQTYPSRELVVVNSSGRPFFGRAPGFAREVEAAPATLGELRNIGCAHAGGEWLAQWDDDDWSSPWRLAAQMACRREGACVLLSRQARVDVRAGTAALARRPGGCPGTLLWPRGPYRFRATSSWEDILFLQDHFPPGRRVVADLSGPGGEPLHVAVWHGRNATPASEFLGGDGPRPYDEARVPGLYEALAEYGLPASPPPGQEGP